MTKGVRVSHWQEEMDWETTKDKANFALIRAGSISTKGELYADFRLKENIEKAFVWVAPGYWWYFRPQFYPEGQANYFLKLLEDVPSFMLGVCIQETGGLPPRVLASRVFRFVQRLKRDRPETKVVINTTQSFWDQRVFPLQWGQYDLWVNRWNAKISGPWSDGKFEPRDWNDWTLWEYSQKNGLGKEFGAGSDHIGVVRFNGDIETFRKWLIK